MNIERKDTDLLTAEIAINLSPEDYQLPFDRELQKQSKEAKLKGFRKGKVPKKTLMKMFGKSIMAEVLLREVNAALNAYLKENKINILGDPLPGSDQQEYNFDPFQLIDYSFHFEIGMEPSFTLQGVGDGSVYTYYETMVTDAMVDDQLESQRKRMGERKEVEEGIQAGDLVYMQSVELLDGKPKEGGFETEVVVLIDVIDDEKVKNNLIGGKVGDKVTFEPGKLEKDSSSSHVRKHILKIEDDEVQVGDQFEGEVTKIVRVIPAEMNEEFFNAFGEGVSDVEGARNMLRKDLEGFYKKQGEAIFYRHIQDELMEKNGFGLPEQFLKKWILSENPEAGSNDNFNKELAGFMSGMRWSLIQRKLVASGQIGVSHGEILDHFVDEIRGYMGGSPVDDHFLVNTARQLMDNQEQVSRAQDRLLQDKVMDYVSQNVEKDIKKVSSEELTSIIKTLNEK